MAKSALYYKLLLCYMWSTLSFSQAHIGPIVLKGSDLKPLVDTPIQSLILYATDTLGNFRQIPFQVDEVNQYGDYILPHGQNANSHEADGRFNLYDEISLMGNDLGSHVAPRFQNAKLPDLLYKITFNNSISNRNATFFAAIYHKNIPKKPLHAKYVIYNPRNSTIKTSRFTYRFSKDNYLITHGLESNQDFNPIQKVLDKSMFDMTVDLKYFITFTANQDSISSEIDAFKQGPIRSIIRVNFSYRLLAMKMDFGMYTEISFFSNAIFLPAIIYFPFDGPSVLNEQSYLTYGLAFDKNQKYTLDTNLDWLHERADKQKHNSYYAHVSTPSYFLKLLIQPSRTLYNNNVKPFLTKTPLQSKLDALNHLGVVFDLKQFPEGEHMMGFKMFYENQNTPEVRQHLSTLQYWDHSITSIEPRH